MGHYDECRDGYCSRCGQVETVCNHCPGCGVTYTNVVIRVCPPCGIQLGPRPGYLTPGYIPTQEGPR
jgi:hypothetical protein